MARPKKYSDELRLRAVDEALEVVIIEWIDWYNASHLSLGVRELLRDVA